MLFSVAHNSAKLKGTCLGGCPFVFKQELW